MQTEYQIKKLDEDLYKAVFEEEWAQARALLLQGANIEQTNIRHESLLFLFAMKQKIACVNFLKKEGADLEAEDMNGDTLFSYSMLHKKWFIGEWALENKANVNRENNVGTTPLIQAISSNSVKFVDKIINAGGSVDYITSNGNNAFLVAFSRAADEILEIMMDHGQNFKVTDEKKNNLVHLGALNKTSAKHCLYVLDKEPSLLNDRNIYNETPLALAAMTGSLELMKECLDRGADPNVSYMGRMEKGHTAFQIAVLLGDQELVDNFISKNVQVNNKSEDGSDTVTFAMMSRGLSLEMVNKLDSAGLNFHGTNVNGWNALHSIALRQDFDKEIFSFLLDKGVDPNKKADITVEGFSRQLSATDIIVMRRQNEVIDDLISRGIDISSSLQYLRSNDYKQMGEVAVQFDLYKKTDATKEDLQKKFDEKDEAEKLKIFEIVSSVNKSGNIDYQNNDGETPLFMAIKNKDMVMIDALLKNGSDPLLKNKEGVSPLLYAFMYNSEIFDSVMKQSGIDLEKQYPEILMDGIFNSPDSRRQEFLKNVEKITSEKILNLIDADGNNAVIISSATAQEDVIQIMLKNKAVTLNHKNLSGETALFHAVSQSSPYIVKLLIENGEKYNIKLSDGVELSKFASYNSDKATTNALFNAMKENPQPEDDNSTKKRKAKP